MPLTQKSPSFPIRQALQSEWSLLCSRRRQQSIAGKKAWGSGNNCKRRAKRTVQVRFSKPCQFLRKPQSRRLLSRMCSLRQRRRSSANILFARQRKGRQAKSSGFLTLPECRFACRLRLSAACAKPLKSQSAKRLLCYGLRAEATTSAPSSLQGLS